MALASFPADVSPSSVQCTSTAASCAVIPNSLKQRSNAVCSRMLVRKSRDIESSACHSRIPPYFRADFSPARGFPRNPPFLPISVVPAIALLHLASRLNKALLRPILLEVEAELHGFRTRRDIVRAAKRGEEVVQRHFVCQIDHREPQTPLVAVAVEEIVLAHADIKEAARGDALWIVIVVFLTGCGYFDECRSEPCRIAGQKCCSRRAGNGRLPVAGEPRLKFLVGGQRQSCEVVNQQHGVVGPGGKTARGGRRKARHCTGHQPVVISPVKRRPRSAF